MSRTETIAYLAGQLAMADAITTSSLNSSLPAGEEPYGRNTPEEIAAEAVALYRACEEAERTLYEGGK